MQQITNGNHHVVQGFYQLRMAVEEPVIVQRLHAQLKAITQVIKEDCIHNQ